MINTKHLRWIGFGTIVTFLMGLLAIMTYQAIILAPLLIEIASVTWNDSAVG